MSEGAKESQAEKAIPASTDIRANLKEIFESKMNTYGHGTTIENAKTIIAEGLKSRIPELGTTAIALFNHEKPFEHQIDSIMEMVQKWPHLEQKAIIIISLPAIIRKAAPSIRRNRKSEMMKIGGLAYQSRSAPFFRRIQGEHDSIYDLSYFLPSNYIRGYVDAKNNEFIANLGFDPGPALQEEEARQRIDESRPKTSKGQIVKQEEGVKQKTERENALPDESDDDDGLLI